MSPSSSTEDRRLKEVQKYKCIWNSPKKDIPVDALAAYLQLTAFKLNAQRCLVSLVDKDFQYFLAEATQTSTLKTGPQNDEILGDLWMGCSGSTARSVALCSMTIHADPDADGHAVFVANNLDQDPRYKDLPYVCEAPHFRFYAGTPLTTAAGLRIGSLFIIEDKPRDNFGHNDVATLGMMAELVGRQLEIEREFHERLRYKRLTKGLTKLVDLRSQDDRDTTNFMPPILKKRSGSESTMIAPSMELQLENGNEQSPLSAPSRKLEHRPRNDSQREKTASIVESEDPLLGNAAELLRSSMGVCQVLFLDLMQNAASIQYGDSPATVSASASQGSVAECKSTKPVPRSFLRQLRTKSHNGRIWNFVDYEGYEQKKEEKKPEEEIKIPVVNAEKTGSANDVDLILQKCFPYAKQAIYAPLWDSVYGGTTSACLIVTNKDMPIFTESVDLNYLRVYLNTLGVLYSHSAVKKAEEQKEQFVSSASHELRTPLHGIIASAELLSGSDLQPRQAALCRTIDICGQTLLDTITQVIDHTRAKRTVGYHAAVHQKSGQDKPASAHGSVSYVSEDLAVLCEEAINVLMLSHATAWKVRATTSTPSKDMSEFMSDPVQAGVVQVTLDFEPGDWTFFCKPGELRRICINLVRNSLKFTDKGSIDIGLRFDKSKGSDGGNPHKSVVILSVKDTGRGMSKEFLRDRLFMPFSQEATSNDGLGLGLSIVSDLIKGMDGSISISSELGKGTVFEISLPLERPFADQLRQPNPVTKEHSRFHNKTFAVANSLKNGHPSILQAITHYMKNWYKCTEISSDAKPDWFFVSTSDISDDKVVLTGDGFAIAITQTSLSGNTPTSHSDNLLYLDTPIGPQKLATVFQEALSMPNKEEDTSSYFDQTQTQISMGDIKTGAPRTNALQAVSAVADSPPRRPPLQNVANGSGSRREKSLPSISETALKITSLKVLCVDDNGINLRILQQNLKKVGFPQVKAAMDGQEALKMIQDSTEPYGLIFMDLTMPVMDGFVCTQQVRGIELEKGKSAEKVVAQGENPSRHRALIIALTSLTSQVDHMRAMEAGVDRVITKPLRFKELKTLVEELDVALQT